MMVIVIIQNSIRFITIPFNFKNNVINIIYPFKYSYFQHSIFLDVSGPKKTLVGLILTNPRSISAEIKSQTFAVSPLQSSGKSNFILNPSLKTYFTIALFNFFMGLIKYQSEEGSTSFQ